MNTDNYQMIFKRKSFHLFRGVGSEQIDPEELKEIETAYAGFESLYPDIRTVPAAAVAYYNRIDIGIYLCFLELCLTEKGIVFSRRLFPDDAGDDVEYSKVAEYSVR